MDEYLTINAALRSIDELTWITNYEVLCFAATAATAAVVVNDAFILI